MNNIKFSIIIPNYNKKYYIEQCLNSVLNQTIDKDKVEIIVIDDGSNDGSLEIIKKYNVILLETNRKRAGGARNKGIEVSNGEYIIFLDSDDYLSENDVLEKLEKKIKDEDIIYFNFTKTNLDGKKSIIVQDRISIHDRLAKTKYLGVPTCCFKKEILSNIRFIENCSYEDVSFILTALCKCKKESYFDESFFTYRKVENSNTTDMVKERQMIDLIIQISNLYYLCETYPKYKEDILFRIKNDNLIKRIQILEELLTTGNNTFREHFPL